jgi:pentatricopeptide repeat protein
MTREKLTVLSSTLAEIYIRQGHFDKARKMYEKLLLKDRTNDLYRSRLLMLSKDSPETKKLKMLSSLLKRIEERRDEREPIKQST